MGNTLGAQKKNTLLCRILKGIDFATENTVQIYMIKYIASSKLLIFSSDTVTYSNIKQNIS